jgi:hypothetical protein
MVSSQSEDELVSLLQNLADMDITYKALQVILTSIHFPPLFAPVYAGLRKKNKFVVAYFCKMLN